MDSVILLVLVVFGACGLLTLLFWLLGVFKKPQLPSLTDYERQEYLLSPAELDFFNVLVASVAKDQYVFAKVRIGDLVRVKGLIAESTDWWRKFGPIAKKHVDFVVCTRSPVKPLVALELDDSSHLSARARARDSLVDRVMKAAGLPLIHLPYSKRGYYREQIAATLTAALAQTPISPHEVALHFTPKL
jgi:hypothetical protein